MTTNKIDLELANMLAVPAMMASNTYLDSDRTYFPLEILGWQKISLEGMPIIYQENTYKPKTSWGRIFSNLQFDIWEHKQLGKTVFAFKGTDEKIDWLIGNLTFGISIPYKSAKKHVRKYMERNPVQNVSLTGHSLGGGLALSVSVWEGIDAIVFNTSPRIFDGMKDMNKPAKRIAVYQEKDILQLIRKVYPKFREKIKQDDIIRTNFTYSNGSNHRADLLAEGILRCAKNNPELIKLAAGIEKKVDCTF